MTCPECGGLGWLLNEYHAGDGPDDPSLPLSLDLLPCIYPVCDARDGSADPLPIATLAIRGQFTDVVRSPLDGSVMALTGFTGPAYR